MLIKGFRTSGLGLISPMRLDGQKDTQSVKTTYPVLNSEFHVEGNNEERKTSTRTYLITFSEKILDGNFIFCVVQTDT